MMMIIFFDCNWVFTRRQRSVDLYGNRKETAIYKRRSKTQNNKNMEHKKYKTKYKKYIKQYKNTEYTKYKTKYKKQNNTQSNTKTQNTQNRKQNTKNT
jgi:hypothetical protein